MADSDLAEELQRERQRSEKLQRQLAESEQARARLLRQLKQETARGQQLKAASEKIREQLESLEAIYNNLPVGICIVDTELRYVSVNRRLAEMHGLPVEAHHGRPVREVIPALAPRVEPILQQVLDSGEPALNVELTTNDSPTPSTCQTWRASCHPLGQDEQPLVGVCGVIQDITVQKRTERSLQQSQRIQAEAEKLAATGRMAARIAHEINNPLAGIKNSFILIKKAVPPDHPRYEFVSLIEKEIDRIAQIVRQMYDLHRPKQDVEREICVADMIQDVIVMLQPVCKRHRVLIGVEMPDRWLVTYLPEGSVRQILYNLLTNAIEASPHGGIVKISVQRTETALSIRVADRGEGIPLDLQTQVFEPFFTTKERAAISGLGLGLSICKGIVEALGGSIEFQSERGQGSVFCVKLPQH